MMDLLAYTKDILTVASVLTLLVTGLAISLKSGMIVMGPDRPRVALVNLSQLVLTLGGSLLALGVIQQFVGFRLGMIW